MCLLKNLLFFVLLSKAYCAQVANQKPLTINEMFGSNLVIKSCSTIWAKPSNITFLKRCDILPPPISSPLNKEYTTGYLCMVYYDLVTKMCLDANNIIKEKENTKTEEDINKYFEFNSTEVAKDYCNTSHTDILQVTANNSLTRDYVTKFVNVTSDNTGCELFCIDFDKQLNKFCKSILWMTKFLSSHQDNINSMNKMNQMKESREKTLHDIEGNNIHHKDVPSTKEQQITNGVPESSVKTVTQDIKNDKKLTLEVSQSHTSGSDKLQQDKVASGSDTSKVIEEIHQEKKTESVSDNLKSVSPSLTNVKENDGIVDDTSDKQEIPMDDNFEDQDTDQLDTDVDGAQRHGGVPDESASGVAGGAAPMEPPINDIVKGASGVTLSGSFEDAEDNHFVPYFLIICTVLISGYILFHNKNKVLGLMLEGRRNSSRRRCPAGGPAYRKLDSTLEEVVNSTPPSYTQNIVF